MPTREALLKQYIAGPALLEEKIKGLTEKELLYKPSEKAWSIKEVVIHIADSEVNAFLRYRAILAEPGKDAFVVDEAKWAEELKYQSQSMEDYLHLFRILRKITYQQLIMAGNSDEVWKERYINHSTFGKINLERWLEIYTDHITTHLKQIDRNLSIMEN